MRHLVLVLISCALLSCAELTALAQEAVSPEVQELYAQAKAAQIQGDTSAAIAKYRAMLKLAPRLAPAYNNLGSLYYDLGRYQDAIPVLKQGLVLAPEMHGAQIMLGASYLEAGHATQAIAPLESAVKALPADRFARMALARALISAEKPREAVPQLEAVLKSDARDQEAWYALGKLYLQLSQQALSQVQTIDSNTPLAHELSGEVMESMQNTPGAIAEYKQAIAVAPDDPRALEHLADAYWKSGDWTHARDGYAALLDKQPSNCMAHWKLANTLDELGETAQVARKQLDLALAQCPGIPQAHAERARLLLRTGHPAEAIPDLKFAEKAAPDEPSVQQLLAQAYRAVGDTGKAAEANLRFQQLENQEHAAKERHAASVIRANQ